MSRTTLPRFGVLTCNTSMNTTREVWELFPVCTRCGFQITESDVMQRDPQNPFRVVHYLCPESHPLTVSISAPQPPVRPRSR